MRFFNQISLSTPESVELDFRLAGIGNRTYALSIDYTILTLIIVAFWAVWGAFTIGLLSYLDSTGRNYSAAPIWLIAIGILVNFILFNGYFMFFEVTWQGQTPGKRFAKIRVVQDDGRPIGVNQAALRSLLHLIDDFFFIGALFIVLSKREKRIGDQVAGTLVIQEERGDRKSKLVISEPARAIAAQLPAISNLNNLIPDDYAIIQEYLQRRDRMSAKARNAKSMELAQQLRALVELETVPADTTSDHFLEAVYVAYQQLTGRE